jgi:hypothetical protein
MAPSLSPAIVDHRPLYHNGSSSYISSRNLCLPSLSYNYQISFEYSFPPCSLEILDGICSLLSTLAMVTTGALEVHSLLAALYISSTLKLDSPSIPLRSPSSPLALVNRRPINSINRRIRILRVHCDRCLRFLTNRYLTLEAAKASKWYQEYRRAAARIDCLQRQV